MSSYETADIKWQVPASSGFSKKEDIVAEILRYGGYLVKRQLISNTFGNIAIRDRDPSYPVDGVIYTKCRGVSLEEMQAQHVVVTSVESNDLIAGTTPPSNGHQMNRAILAARPDVNAVIHTHADLIISFFSQLATTSFRFVSVDTALVLGAEPRILPRHINLESDSSKVNELVQGTNCLVMPNHGLTTLGTTVSQAFHRHTAFLAEVHRVLMAMWVRSLSGQMPDFVPDTETEHLFGLGHLIVYGEKQ